jgi:photosynthetic reaction center cytochrome c subunit
MKAMNHVSMKWGAIAAFGCCVMVAGCERPPIETIQRGYRGVAMEQNYNPRILATKTALNAAPASLGEPTPGGPPASSVYKNVQVLNDVGAAEFTRLMVAMTQWVSPDQGCAYCHVVSDMASDELYTKVVARRMLQMTRQINTDWKTHVANTGVTCYTCHRGQPVPANVWFIDPGPKTKGMAGNKAGQNMPAPQVGLTSLPFDPFTPFLDKGEEIRVLSTTALPTGNHKSIKQTEWTYALMMHMSQSLGVNCTYCHNSRSFFDWDQSTPQRATAWYGIRLVRAVNDNYLDPLAHTFPTARLGPNGDGPKANCATCHQGAYKPLYGAKMLKDYPELAGPATGTGAAGNAAAAAAASATANTSGVVADLLAKIYFDTAVTTINPEGMKTVADAAKVIAGHAGMKVDISGFADKTGNAEQNLELAKQRALSVRDALKDAGVADDRINLKKPDFSIGGSEADARRVDITAQ